MAKRLADKKRGLSKALLAWYGTAARDLPWRRTRDPYLIWLAEIMLQQTRVDTGIAYYERFRTAFPTVEALAAASQDQVLKLWEGLGYYSRARNLHKAAQAIVADHGGHLPKTVDGLIALPGVGRYTAAAVASIAYGVPAAVLDGNVKRVLARLYAIEESIDDGAVHERLWELAQALMPKTGCGDFNQAMMELGATVCSTGSPQCLICPVRKFCQAAAAGNQADLPVRKKARQVPHVVVVAGAVRDKRGRYLIGQRPEGKMLAGLWEFPGGKVQKGESLAEALKRELHEELGIHVLVGEELAFVDHAYSHFTMRLHLLACTVQKGRAKAIDHAKIAWVKPGEFAKYAFPASDIKLMKSIPR
ncbi:MAG TPA: A/G-specific adenine glycosylase [Planctomycetota bacterium]|nr:A/G-specific adenine glycosylase [Planctomycetota bacterium]